MTRALVLFFILGALVFAVLLNMLLLPPGSTAQEPEPRASPTPQPWIQLAPDHAVAGQDLRVLVTGICWPSPGSVRLNWEHVDGPTLLSGPAQVGLDGGFTADIHIPAAWATPGSHVIFAAHSAGQVVAASLSFAAPTPTDAPSPIDTPLPTDTSVPQPTATPSRTPSLTPTASPTLTPTPSRTMRPVTPDVTSTPRPAATPRPATALPGALAPTSSEAPTTTPTASATASAMPRFLAMVSATAADTDTPTPTAMPTATATPSRTPEVTSTYPPVPRETRDPGQQLAQVVATPRPAAQVEASLVEAGRPQSGSRWESGFVLGFVAAVILLALLIILVLLVLVTLLVSWRIMQMRRTGRAA